VAREPGRRVGERLGGEAGRRRLVAPVLVVDVEAALEAARGRDEGVLREGGGRVALRAQQLRERGEVRREAVLDAADAVGTRLEPGEHRQCEGGGRRTPSQRFARGRRPRRAARPASAWSDGSSRRRSRPRAERVDRHEDDAPPRVHPGAGGREDLGFAITAKLRSTVVSGRSRAPVSKRVARGGQPAARARSRRRTSYVAPIAGRVEAALEERNGGVSPSRRGRRPAASRAPRRVPRPRSEAEACAGRSRTGSVSVRSTADSGSTWATTVRTAGLPRTGRERGHERSRQRVVRPPEDGLGRDGEAPPLHRVERARTDLHDAEMGVETHVPPVERGGTSAGRAARWHRAAWSSRARTIEADARRGRSATRPRSSREPSPLERDGPRTAPAPASAREEADCECERAKAGRPRTMQGRGR
jgi:hypothetical protein